jgi:hypothetical protein
MKLTAQQVWEAIIADPKFTSQMPEGSPQRDAIRPFIEGSVATLEDQLENTVTLQAIADAKLKFLRYCVKNNLGKVMGDVMGMGAEMLNGLLEQLIEMLEPMLENTTAFLEENGVTEEQVMTSPQVGMSANNQRKWREGTLTIGELLLTQPSVILQNNT